MVWYWPGPDNTSVRKEALYGRYSVYLNPSAALVPGLHQHTEKKACDILTPLLLVAYFIGM